MKTTLKISGILGISLFIVSILFKMNHFPGGSLLILLGIVSLLFAYIPTLILTVRRENIVRQSRSLFYLGVISVALTLAAYLFGVNHWPYQSYLIAASLFSVLIFLLVFFIRSVRSTENTIINMSMVLGFSLIYFLIVSNTYRTMTSPGSLYFTHEYHLEETNHYFQSANSKLSDKFTGQADSTGQFQQLTALQFETEGILSSIDTVRKHLFNSTVEKEQFNNRFLKNYVGETEPAFELLNQLQSFSGHITNYASSWEDEDLSIFAASIVNLDKEVLYLNPVLIDNTLLRLQCDIQILQREFLLSYSMKTAK